jgi:formyl-CoA transferase
MNIEHPVEGEVKSIGFPVKLSGTPQQVRRHPPLLGEHTEEILAELGIDPKVLA